jgi:hypothetical protein
MPFQHSSLLIDKDLFLKVYVYIQITMYISIYYNYIITLSKAHNPNICGSTQVLVQAWNNLMKGIQGIPSPLKLESQHMTVTVLVPLKIQLPRISHELV